MNPSELAKKQCVPCRGGTPALQGEALARLARQVEGWKVENQHHITKRFKFPDFARALEAVNRIGALAEDQGHHPDLHLTWGEVGVTIWTHKVDGLTESDFILAAKIDEVLS